MKRPVDLGLLYSRSGSYALMGEACRRGALSAVAAVNADPAIDVEFRIAERDPAGNIDLYAPMCEDILRRTKARHVIGCVTSWSRKEVIPVMERTGATLWYNLPYEGFEASDHVVYGHGCPNQHLLPLLGWSFSQTRRRGYLTGSNYIWGWEMNRLAREVTLDAGGEILGERYLPMGAVDVGRIIEEIRATRPDFILNNLIGPSQAAFLNAYQALAAEDPHFTPALCLILSCNLIEDEQRAIGAASEGVVAAAPYFRNTNPDAPGSFENADEQAAWAAVWRLARLLHGREGSENLPLSSLLTQQASAETGIDARTHHSALPVLIAQVRGGSYQVVKNFGVVAGDPYLSAGRPLLQSAQKLRVVK